MRRQIFIKFFLSWNPNYPHSKTDDTSGKCDFCKEEKPRLALLYDEFGNMHSEICEECAERLPTPAINSTKEFYNYLLEENRKYEKEERERDISLGIKYYTCPYCGKEFRSEYKDKFPFGQRSGDYYCRGAAMANFNKHVQTCQNKSVSEPSAGQNEQAQPIER